MKIYAQNSLLLAALLATLGLTYVGCSGGSFGGITESAAKDGKKKDVSTTDDSGAGTGSAGQGSKPAVAVEDKEDDKASEPAQVAGAFLACNMDATLDGTDAENVAFGCVLTRADKKIALTDFEKVDWSLVDGKGEKIATRVYKMPESSAYHVGAPIPRALAAEARGEVVLTVAGKAYAKKAPEPVAPPEPEGEIEDSESETGGGTDSDSVSGPAPVSGEEIQLHEPKVVAKNEAGGIAIRDQDNAFIHLGDEEILKNVDYNKGCAAAAYGTKRFGKKLKMRLTISSETQLTLRIKDACGYATGEADKAPRVRIREDEGDNEDVLLDDPVIDATTEFKEITLKKGSYRLTVSSIETVKASKSTWDDFAFSELFLATDPEKVVVSEIRGDD